MAKVRVYELAKEFGVESKVVLDQLHRLGVSGRTASSSIDAPAVRRLVDALLGPSAAHRAEALISRPFVGHANRVASVAFSPDGAELASVDPDGTVRLWNPTTGQELRAIAGHTEVFSVVFSPDGRMLAGAGDDGTVRLWDPATGKELHTLTGHSSTVTSVAFSPHGTLLAAASGSGAQLWDAATGEERHVLRARRVRVVTFSPDGETLIGAGDEGVQVWSPRSGEQVFSPPEGFDMRQRGLSSVAFSHDGALLACADSEGAHLWNLATGRRPRTLLTQAVLSVAFSPDDTVLVGAYFDGTLRMRSSATGEELRTLAGHTATVSSVAFGPDGALLASAGGDGTIRVWNPVTGQQLAGTGFGEAARLRPLPGLHSDTPPARRGRPPRQTCGRR
ncbi:WD40 repeat domain-containing protein [Streptomyces sp. KS_5]|uniref:WD40 repeat domain-containing protein n=1 Tax=Streptomyces sp. KS_5 TaxID=1881018 RepID=UPI000899E9BE|nr:translation initiation factor IF-2 N-terminal domain-containing protein [Streptomyces sp. KS_5]SEE35101.1 WD domain-containing protein, G-beta repeat-containing protein [Streptomyces sp. KS_5]